MSKIPFFLRGRFLRGGGWRSHYGTPTVPRGFRITIEHGQWTGLRAIP